MTDRAPSRLVDLLAARIAAGNWKAPAEESAEDKDGFKDQLLRGGYASFLIESPIQQVQVLPIRGRHRAFYIIGRPLVGNIYDHGRRNASR